MKPLKLALLITCVFLSKATAAPKGIDASKTVHESECPCLLCWWCEPEEPHKPPPHEEPVIPPPHEKPVLPPPHEEPHDHPIPDIPELPPLPDLPPIPKFCPPSKEEPEIPHYPPSSKEEPAIPHFPPPPHVYMYQPNPTIAAGLTNSGAAENDAAVPSVLVAWALAAAVLYLFG